MIKLYANFNFLRVYCPKCRGDVFRYINNDFLKKLAKYLETICSDIIESDTKIVEYKFICKKCNIEFKKNISVERVKSCLIVD